MKKKNFIRRIYRDLPETNSSSSHSIIINTQEIDYDPEYWNLDEYIHDGVLYLGGGIEFDGAMSRSNNLYDKIIFTCGYVYCAYNFNNSKLYETLGIIRDLILEMTDIKEVNFTWIENRYRELENENNDEFYDDHPTIDHQSADMWEEILESKETIKNFLFNRNSWYITTQDGDVELSFYDVNNVINESVYLRVFVGGKLDHIDIELDTFPINFKHNQFYYLEPLSQIAYNKETGKLVTEVNDIHSKIQPNHIFTGYSEDTNTFNWGPISNKYEIIIDGIGVIKS